MSLPVGPTLRAFAARVASRGREVTSTLSAEIVVLVSMAVTFPLITRGLGVDLYGKYTVLYLISGLAGLWVFAAPSAAAVQLILQLDRESAKVRRLGRRQVLVTAAPVAVVGTAVVVGLYGSSMLAPAILVLAVDFILSGLANIELAVIFSVDGVVRSTRIRILHPALRAAGVVALAVGGVITIVSLVSVNIAASAVLYLCSRRAGRRPRRSAELGTSDPRAAELVRYSSFYATSMSTNAVQNEGEKVVLASTRPSAEVGQYAAAYRIVSLTLVPFSAVLAAANRWFLMRDEREGAQLARAARLFVPITLYGVVASAAIFLGRNMIQWVAGSEFDEVATIAAWLCLLPLLHGLAELPPMGLLGLGRNRERMLMGFATSAVALCAYLLLVPSLGWRGAVIGTYLSETAAIIAGWVLLARYQRIADRRTQLVVPASTSPA